MPSLTSSHDVADVSVVSCDTSTDLSILPPQHSTVEMTPRRKQVLNFNYFILNNFNLYIKFKKGLWRRDQRDALQDVVRGKKDPSRGPTDSNHRSRRFETGSFTFIEGQRIRLGLGRQRRTGQ